ncbi:MAG: hypothetical protein AAF541_00795 [Pseudomonadota bacterium]
MNYQLLRDLYRKLSLRERGLVVATLAAFTWGLWISTFGGVLIDEASASEQKLVSMKTQLAQVSTRFASLRAQGESPDLVALRDQQEALLKDVELAQEQLDRLVGRFVPPQQVPLFLEDMLKQFRGLQLTRLNSEASEKIVITLADLPAHTGVANGQAGETIEVYRHPFELELQGKFHDVVGYLHNLEQGSWQFQWRSLDYVVGEYPTARVLLRIETLSSSREWIGV